MAIFGPADDPQHIRRASVIRDPPRCVRRRATPARNGPGRDAIAAPVNN